MDLNRRHLLTAAATGAAAFASPLSAFGLDAAQFGVRPGAPGDQSAALQRAIDQAARTRVPLMLAPGVYRAGGIKLPVGANLAGVRGATRLILTQGPSLVSAEHAETVSLSGLTFDGGGQLLPAGRALVHFDDVKAVRVSDCEVSGAGGNGVTFESCEGEVTHNTITGAADNALFCNDSRGLLIAANIIAQSGNGGIRVWQSDKRRDGSLIADNRIEDTAARAGGSGENGNAINVFRAADVIVRGNHIRNAAFSAIRGNSASNIQIIGNNCAALDEVAIYSEFGFEGAVIADNVIDGAETGISVTNFDQGGRLATVHGNIVRNLGTRRANRPPEEAGVGIGVEADTVVSGNVIERAPRAGISAGWGQYLRNVAVTGNVVREAGFGVAVSVVAGAGVAVISGNLFAGTTRGAIVGME
ncbi:MAG TPA: TIGR03808 family TAT-translocated repetitive protein [Pseudolabrys sp.]|nr:TIGR03808 family TAT-translocated repetitive protein [Pseudolabrys sp.]